MNSISKTDLLPIALLLSVGLALSGQAYAADPPDAIPDVELWQHPQQQRHHMRVSILSGSEVKSVNGEKIGEIKDVIVDISNERADYALLSFGGFLGFGKKLFAFPVEAFRQAEGEDNLILILDISKDRLKEARGFEPGSYPDWSDPLYGEEIDRYRGAAVSPRLRSKPELHSAGKLMGRDVNDRDGNDMGEIKDVVVNMRNGELPYVLFAFNKLDEVNEQMVLVSLRSFALPANDDAVLNVDREKLDNALHFEKKRWPNVNNPLFLVDVEGYLVLVDPDEYAEVGTAVAVFRRLDLNQDDKLTPEEARRDSKVFGAWTQFDAQGAGVVTREEFFSKYKEIMQ